MNSGGHVGLGILFYVVAAKIAGHPITAANLLLAMLFSLLPDADVVATYITSIEHRKITHNPYFATALVVLTAIINTPLAMALLSHYLGDYIYPDMIQKLLPAAPGNPVSKSEYYSAAILGSSTLYSYAVIKTSNTWFATATALALTAITLTGVHATLKNRHRRHTAGDAGTQEK